MDVTFYHRKPKAFCVLNVNIMNKSFVGNFTSNHLKINLKTDKNYNSKKLQALLINKCKMAKLKNGKSFFTSF